MNVKRILRIIIRLTGCRVTGVDKTYMAIGVLVAGALPAVTGVLGVEVAPIAVVASVFLAAFSAVTIVGALIAPLIL